MKRRCSEKLIFLAYFHCWGEKVTIVVSGVGLITPLGRNRDATWTALTQGKTAIQAGEQGLQAVARDFSVNGACSRMGDFAVQAAREALAQAGLLPAHNPATKSLRIGCAISQSKPILSSHTDSTTLDASLLISSFSGWSSESVVQRELGLQGPVGNIAAACATGVASIELGAHWISSGRCDAVLVGASESSLHPLYQAGFRRMGVLTEGTDASAACPFDRRRSGFVMGEGAAALVLEEETFSHRRGGRPLATLLGVKMRHSSCDALRFDPNGDSIARLIKDVLGHVDTPDYINAHGTGTLFNDLAETRGIRRAFGAKADRIPVSSTKAATGHLLGAAGAVEAAFCVLALQEGIIPPTLHWNEPDPECDLDYVPSQARRTPLQTAMSLSYGFGGQMGAVLFGRC